MWYQIGLVDHFKVSFGVLLYQVKVRVCQSGTEVRVLTTTVLETIRDCIERQTVRDHECQKTVRGRDCSSIWDRDIGAVWDCGGK